MRRVYRLALVLFCLLMSMGCSSQYWLERTLYMTNIKVFKDLPRIKEMPEAEVNSLLNDIDVLLAKAKSRKMTLPFLKLKILIYGARGNYSELKKILDKYPAKIQVVFLYDLYRLGLRLRDLNLCLWSLEKVKPFLSRRSLYSLPYLKCIAGLKCNKDKAFCKAGISYYTKLMLSKKATLRFYGYEGLFLSYLNLGKRDEAMSVLRKLLEDRQLPLTVLFAGLRQEISLLYQTKAYNKIIKLLNSFLHDYGMKMKPEVKNRLEKLIKDLKARLIKSHISSNNSRQ